jgi:hypothetical protein
MDAFKEHAIANIKDLRHEMMLEYVHHELVPKLLLKCENKSGCLFDDNNGNDHDAAAVTNNNTVAVSNELASDAFNKNRLCPLWGSVLLYITRLCVTRSIVRDFLQRRCGSVPFYSVLCESVTYRVWPSIVSHAVLLVVYFCTYSDQL